MQKSWTLCINTTIICYPQLSTISLQMLQLFTNIERGFQLRKIILFQLFTITLDIHLPHLSEASYGPKLTIMLNILAKVNSKAMYLIFCSQDILFDIVHALVTICLIRSGMDYLINFFELLLSSS